MGLYRIIYASRACNVSLADLESILDACQRNNPLRCISGMLLFDNGHFLQLLEGDRGAVSDCFLRIAKDTRHRDVQLLICGPIEARLFTRWSMYHVATHGAQSEMLRRYQTGLRFDPFAMTASAVEQLCIDATAAAMAAGCPETRGAA